MVSSGKECLGIELLDNAQQTCLRGNLVHFGEESFATRLPGLTGGIEVEETHPAHGWLGSGCRACFRILGDLIGKSLDI